MRELEREAPDTHPPDSGARPDGARRMKTVRTVAELRAALAEPRRAGAVIGLVPTMGAFHPGHLSLFRRARERCDVVAVSLFVNPRQFGPSDGLDSYPRAAARDRELAAAAGVDVLFTPAVEEIYPQGFATTVSVAGLSEPLCGVRRGRSHFDGVTTVVAKLLLAAAPEVAFFGRKDAQQAIVIRRMVADLGLPAEIEVCPTVRETDGLAHSSRNRHLRPADRERAPALHHALLAADALFAAGERDTDAILQAAATVLERHGVEPEYLELRSAETLEPLPRVDEQALLAVAATFGDTRLIDNTILDPR